MVVAREAGSAPRLVVTKPEHLTGTAYSITGDSVVVGRQEGCDVRLDDVAVSRAHATIRRSSGQTVVSDLGSSNGTTVNGDPVGNAGRPLRSGDVVRFGNVEMRFQAPPSDVTDAVEMAEQDGPHRAAYSVESQAAGQLNNVAHDQHISYVQQIRQERDSFARDIAATKTKARRLIWVGFASFIVGFSTYLWVIFRFVGQVDQLSAESGFDSPRLFGPEVGGVPVGLIGFAFAAFGSILMVVGLVLHIVAASRRRRLEERAPAPWQYAPPPQPSGW